MARLARRPHRPTLCATGETLRRAVSLPPGGLRPQLGRQVAGGAPASSLVAHASGSAGKGAESGRKAQLSELSGLIGDMPEPAPPPPPMRASSRRNRPADPRKLGGGRRQQRYGAPGSDRRPERGRREGHRDRIAELPRRDSTWWDKHDDDSASRGGAGGSRGRSARSSTGGANDWGAPPRQSPPQQPMHAAQRQARAWNDTGSSAVARGGAVTPIRRQPVRVAGAALVTPERPAVRYGRAAAPTVLANAPHRGGGTAGAERVHAPAAVVNDASKPWGTGSGGGTAVAERVQAPAALVEDALERWDAGDGGGTPVAERVVAPAAIYEDALEAWDANAWDTPSEQPRLSEDAWLLSEATSTAPAAVPAPATAPAVADRSGDASGDASGAVAASQGQLLNDAWLSGSAAAHPVKRFANDFRRRTPPGQHGTPTRGRKKLAFNGVNGTHLLRQYSCISSFG
jgi:hypothetical protein